MAANTQFETIELNNANISDKGAKAIMSMASVKYVDFSNYDYDLLKYKNHISDQGVMIIANNSALKSIYLDGNNVTDMGAIALAKNTSLKRLSLPRNDITDDGAIALANNTTLYTLDVSFNKIGKIGIEALEKNTSIEINTEGNPGRNDLQLSLHNNATNFYLLNNRFHEKTH